MSNTSNKKTPYHLSVINTGKMTKCFKFKRVILDFYDTTKYCLCFTSHFYSVVGIIDD